MLGKCYICRSKISSSQPQLAYAHSPYHSAAIPSRPMPGGSGVPLGSAVQPGPPYRGRPVTPGPRPHAATPLYHAGDAIR